MGLKLRITLTYVFKALNFILAVVGAMMTVYSLWVFHEYSVNASDTPSTLTDGILGDDDSITSSMLGNLIRVTYHKTGAKLTWDVNLDLPSSWFAYSFAFVGLFLLLTAIYGTVIAEFPSRTLFSIYIGLYSTFIVFEIIVAFFVQLIGTSNLPTDGSGQLTVILEYIADFPAVSRTALSFIFLVQIAAAVVAYGLRYFETHFISVVREDELRLQAPLLPPHPEFVPVPITY